MTAPHADDERATPASDRVEQADSRLTPQIIRHRRDFLAASRARRWAAPGLVLQGRMRRNGERSAPDDVRVGYTCSKKVGDAVRRNRAKRRLRAAAAEILPRVGRPGWDYVLIGRRDATANRPYPALLADLEQALRKVHETRRPRPQAGPEARRVR